MAYEDPTPIYHVGDFVNNTLVVTGGNLTYFNIDPRSINNLPGGLIIDINNGSIIGTLFPT